jgi:hypothetical protein
VGRKRRITEAQRSAIIALARSVPPGRLVRDGAGELSVDDEGGPAEWTLDTLTQGAREAGIGVGRSQVRRILRAEKKVRWCRTCTRAASRANSGSPQAMPGHKQLPSMQIIGSLSNTRRRISILQRCLPPASDRRRVREPCISIQVTVRPPRRRQPHRDARPSTS